MDDDLILSGRQRFTTEHLIDGKAYRLPARRCGVVVACVLTVFGLVFMSIGLWTGRGFVDALRQGGFDVVVTAMFSLIPILAGLIPVVLAMLLWFGRNSIEVRGDEVRVIDHLGLFRWTRRRAISNIAQLELSTATSSVNNRPEKPVEGFAVLIGIHAESVDAVGKQRMRGAFLMVWGYHRAMLRALAEELADDLEAPLSRPLVGGAHREIGIVESVGKLLASDPANADAMQQPVQRPASATSILEENPDGITLTVPPAGLWKGSKGLFVFSILWNGFIAVFTLVMSIAIINGDGNIDDVGGLLVAAGLIGLFWLVGIGMLVGAIHMARRHVIIDVVGDTLLVTRQTIFKTRQHEWRREQLSHICSGPSGMTVNDRPVLELQVHPREGKKTGVLSQLDEAELAWIAYELRRALGVPAQCIR